MEKATYFEKRFSNFLLITFNTYCWKIWCIYIVYAFYL